jgi:hypothetical protein
MPPQGLPTPVDQYGGTGYITNDPAASTDYTFASFANNNPFSNNNHIQNPYGSSLPLYNDQMNVETQHQRHLA